MAIIVCPHCHFQIAGPDVPDRIEPGMLCPVCYNDMAATPVCPVTGIQVFAKYMGAIIAGPTLALIVTALVIAPLMDGLLGLDTFPAGVVVILGILLMFAVGSTMDGWMATRFTSRKARWLLLLGPFVLCPPVWAFVLWGASNP